jgi:molecular chaperone HtpG
MTPAKKNSAGKKNRNFHPYFQAVCPESNSHSFIIDFKELGEQASPMVITRSEWMRRMKDMSQMQGGMNFYGDMPESLNLVVNTSHPLVKKVLEAKDKKLGSALENVASDIKARRLKSANWKKQKKAKRMRKFRRPIRKSWMSLNNELVKLEESKREKLTDFGKKNKLAKQMVDLASACQRHVKRSRSG